MTENPAIDLLYVLKIDKEALTLSVFTPLEDSEPANDSWQTLVEHCDTHASNNSKAGGADYWLHGLVIKDVPDRPGTFKFTGKSTFWLNSPMIGNREIVDHSIIDILVDDQDRPMPWSSRFSQTATCKTSKSFRYRSQRAVRNAVVIFMPFVEASIDKLRVEVLSGDHAVIGPKPDSEITWRTVPQDGVWFEQWFWCAKPTTAEFTVAANSVVTAKMRLLWNGDNTPCKRVTDLYLSSDCGYLPYTKVKTDENGLIEFPFHSLGLKAGDTVNIKVSGKVFTGIGKCTVKVTE